MLFPGPRFLLSLLVLSCGIAFAQSQDQTGDNCAAARRSLEAIIKEFPEQAVETLVSHVRADTACAGPLVESAIVVSEASDELVAELVTAAVRAAPEKAVIIAESAIAAAPSASDEVADVIQTVLGDCQSIAEDVTISIARNRDRLLVILEDALRRHGNCTCEVVSAAVRAAEGSGAVISQIVEVAVTLKPSLAAEISECASAAAPGQIAAVQQGLDRALKETARGPGALPAAADTEEAEEKFEPEPDVVDADEASAGARSQGKGARAESYGKEAPESRGKEARYGKGKGKVVEEEEEEWEWDWIHWGAWNGHGGAVYLIAPSGGIVPPGVFEPVSPSDPKILKTTLGSEKTSR